MTFFKNQFHQIPVERTKKTMFKNDLYRDPCRKVKTRQDLSSFALVSITKVSEIGVIASLTIFSDSSRAPAMIVVSSCVSSPPLPA